MTRMPKKLQEARDELAQKCVEPSLRSEVDAYIHCWRDGFDSCYELLAPEIEKLVDASERMHRRL